MLRVLISVEGGQLIKRDSLLPPEKLARKGVAIQRLGWGGKGNIIPWTKTRRASRCRRRCGRHRDRCPFEKAVLITMLVWRQTGDPSWDVKDQRRWRGLSGTRGKLKYFRRTKTLLSSLISTYFHPEKRATF